MDSVAFQYLSQAEIKAYQEQCLVETLAYVNERSPFYRRRFAEVGIDVSSIRRLEDLVRLPVTTKEDLQRHNEDFLCVPRTEILDNVPEVTNYIVEVYTNAIGTDGIRILVGAGESPDEGFEKRLKDLFRSKVRVAPDIVFEPTELIARKQMPPTSRKLIKFFDYRVGNV